MEEVGRRYTYFLSRPGPCPPRWIRPAQWAILFASVAAARWIAAGDGLRYMAMSFYNFHGVFTEEILWGACILPNLGLFAVAVLALEIWLQILWMRCRISVAGWPGFWRWTGRKGCTSPASVARTPGGAWVEGAGRWWYMPRGFLSPEGGDWIAECGAAPAPLLHWRRLASPLGCILAALLLSAWALQVPIQRNRHVRAEAVRATREGRLRDAENLIREHPEMRPWVRYAGSLPSCDKAACMRSQIVARLEGLSIGPTYGGDAETLMRLLVLNGWPALALKLAGPDGPPSIDILVRLGLPSEARKLQVRTGRTHGKSMEKTEVALLFEEGRIEEAYQLTGAFTDLTPQRTLAMRAALAYLTGRCDEVRRLAVLLMAPQGLHQSRLEGEAPPTGLGALQRAAREIRVKASCALGLALLDFHAGAGDEWEAALRQARETGLTGLLDMDRVLLRRVAPGGPWDAPAPEHGRAPGRSSPPDPAADPPGP